MSSFSASLKVNGKTYKLEAASFSAVQITGADGKPASKAHAGEIVVTLKVKDDHSLLDWMLDSYKRTDGTITYKKKNENSTLKELSFKKGFCTSYAESFAANSTEDTLVTMSIMAEEVEMLGVKFNG
jgi:hypothetical protein